MNPRQRRRWAITSIALAAAGALLGVGVLVYALAAGEAISWITIAVPAFLLLSLANTLWLYRGDVRRGS